VAAVKLLKLVPSHRLLLFELNGNRSQNWNFVPVHRQQLWQIRHDSGKKIWVFLPGSYSKLLQWHDHKLKMLPTWFEARNSSTLIFCRRAFTKTTITGGLMKFVSTFNTRSVVFFSTASASINAVRSVSPTFVNESASNLLLFFNPAKSCSNLSSEIFYK